MKPWVTPQLVALVRGTPEEMVLASCKAYPYSGEGPSWSVTFCSTGTAGSGVCWACQTPATS